MIKLIEISLFSFKVTGLNLDLKVSYWSFSCFISIKVLYLRSLVNSRRREVTFTSFDLQGYCMTFKVKKWKNEVNFNLFRIIIIRNV